MNSDVLTKVSDKDEPFAGVIPHLKPGKLRCLESKLPNSKTAQNSKCHCTSPHCLQGRFSSCCFHHAQQLLLHAFIALSAPWCTPHHSCCEQSNTARMIPRGCVQSLSSTTRLTIDPTETLIKTLCCFIIISACCSCRFLFISIPRSLASLSVDGFTCFYFFQQKETVRWSVISS